MLNYDAAAGTISSKFTTYKLVDVGEELIYQWIKAGFLSMKAFDAWSRAQRAEAYADGVDSESGGL